MFKLLVDGDIVAFQAASATDGRTYTVSNGETYKYKKEADKRAKEIDGTIELTFSPDPVDYALFLVKKKLDDIQYVLKDTYSIKDPEVGIYLTSQGSFREKEVNPMYKQNRVGTRRPLHLEACKQYMLNRGAILRAGEYEADDLMTMEAKAMEDIGVAPIICSIDKDLRQYPCLHYNFTKKIMDTVTVRQGLLNFYSQLLMGDATDGIIGLKGVGPKTAEKLLAPCGTEFEMYCTVLQEWIRRSQREPEETEELFLARMLYTVRMTGRLLYLCRVEDERWEAPRESK